MSQDRSTESELEGQKAQSQIIQNSQLDKDKLDLVSEAIRSLRSMVAKLEDIERENSGSSGSNQPGSDWIVGIYYNWE
jgi:flagellar motility protein MotE (MotC chaperone)